MFDIGFWELVLISVIALVVLGPERLPHAIRGVARFIATVKQMANGVKDELSQELKWQELQDNLRKAEQMQIKDLSPELQNAVESLKRAAQEIRQPHAETDETASVADRDMPSVPANHESSPADEVSDNTVLPETTAEKHSGSR